jgi:hypothetical protein
MDENQEGRTETISTSDSESENMVKIRVEKSEIKKPTVELIAKNQTHLLKSVINKSFGQGLLSKREKLKTNLERKKNHFK